MKSYKKTIINNINKHFKKIILGFLMLGILFYVIKYYNNKENFNINWNTISYLNHQQDPTNLNSEDIAINSGNLNFNLKCDGTNGLKTLCETCHKNYNNTCFKGNTNNMCDMVLNSNQCENKCGLESPNNSNDYTRYYGNERTFQILDKFSLHDYDNVFSLHQCEKLCDLNKECLSYKYNKKKCSLSLTKEKMGGFKPFLYGSGNSQDSNDNDIFVGQKDKINNDRTCYTKYNYDNKEICKNINTVDAKSFYNKQVLDYKECEKLCNQDTNELGKCEGYTFEKDRNDTTGQCKLYKRFFPSDGCKPFETSLDSLYKDANNEYMFQSGIKL
jgi:hypothetical protein